MSAPVQPQKQGHMLGIMNPQEDMVNPDRNLSAPSSSGKRSSESMMSKINQSNGLMGQKTPSYDTPLRDRIAISEVGLPASIFNKSDDDFAKWYKDKATASDQYHLKKMGYNPEKNVFSPYRVKSAQGKLEDKYTSGIGEYDQDYGDRSAMDIYIGFHKSADKHISEFKERNSWLYNGSVKIDNARLGVLEELSFNMGSDYAKNFPSMFRAIKNGNWAEAARQLKYADPDNSDKLSKWFLDIGGHKNETGRANKLLSILLNGKDDADPLDAKKVKR